MSTNTGVVLLVLAVVGSYGWAVRGTTVGKDRGAMLPGALLGIFLAWFTGSEVIRSNFWIFCAAGALGMTVGGCETYAQTMEHVINAKKAPRPLIGNFGVALKGFLWFGIFGAILGMSFTAASGMIYQLREILIVFVSMLFLRLLGIQIFNKPFNKKTGIRPKLYFSRDRFEEWGGMLFILIELVVFSAIKGDIFALILCGCSALGGAIGWVIAVNMMRVSKYPKKNGKYIFGSLWIKGMIDDRKIQEYTLGAVGALGVGMGFILGFPVLKEHIEVIESVGVIWSPLGDKALLLSIGFIALVFILQPLVGWTIYFAVPMVLLGAVDFSRMLSVLIIYSVLMLEMMFNKDKLPKDKSNLKFRWPIALIGACYLAQEICFHFFAWANITMFTPLFLYLVIYYAIQLFFHDLLPNKMKLRREVAKKEGTGLRPHHFGPLTTQEGFKLAEVVFLWIAAWRLGMFG